MSAAQQKGVSQKGWLHKRGGRIHTWHKRWFTLAGDLLFYFKSPQDNRPTGTIPLAGNRVIRHPDDPKQPTWCKFEIVAGNAGQVVTGNHESYLISAESVEAADSWVAAIKRAMHEPYGGGMFGRSLGETMRVEARLGGSYVPVLLHRCVKFIREHGLHEVGIFRLPGQASRIQVLKDLYDSGSQQDFLCSEDVHTVASLLKLYLRELSEPVVPYVYYDSFRQALEVYFAKEEGGGVSLETEGLDQLKRLFIQLPRENVNVLKYLSRFLHEVEQCSNQNKMNIVNLGTIFGPHLLSPRTNDPHVLMECNSISTNFVRAIVIQHSDLFPPTIDESTPRRLSLVFLPENTPPWLQADQQATMLSRVQKSFYQPQSPLLLKGRQNTAPPVHKGRLNRKIRGSKCQSTQDDGGVRCSQVEISAPILECQPNISTLQPNQSATPSVLLGPAAVNTVHDPHSGTSHAPVVPIQKKDSDESVWKNSPLFNSIGSSDEDVPELLKRLSQHKPASIRQQSDTLSSDMIVNSISSELDTLEWQLCLSQQEVSRYKMSTRLWKNRYEVEYRARLAAEQRVHDLQNLIDETFQQFALDDSEDDSVGMEDEDESTLPAVISELHNGGSQPFLDLSLDSGLAALKPYSSSPALNKRSSCEVKHKSTV